MHEAQLSGDSCFTQSYVRLGPFYALQTNGGLINQLMPTAHILHCWFHSTQLLSAQASPVGKNVTLCTVPFWGRLGSRFTMLGCLWAQVKQEQHGTLAAPMLIIHRLSN